MIISARPNFLALDFLRRLTSAVVLIMILITTSASAQQRFQTPEEAATALIQALRAGESRQLLRLMGPDSADIVISGDQVADVAARRRIIEAYEVKHRLETTSSDKVTLIIGNEEWPFAVPLSHQNGAWRFDTRVARAEILYRRIGANELNAIQTCLAFVDAQQEYAEKGIAGQGVYAQRIVSSPGEKDGLYWPAQPGQEESPLGEFVAAAAAEGYVLSERRIPYHGYYYRILIREGSSTRRGSIDYVVRGKMIGGFALVAYPAEYRKSGVMTFLVNHFGVVYEKDLGPRTRPIASRMIGFNPDVTWRRVDTSKHVAPLGSATPAAVPRLPESN